MRNLDVESKIDEPRPEYERSDLGEFARGAVTQVEFAERVALLMACIGQEEGITFRYRSEGNYLDQPEAGEWTYEISHSDNQVTLHHWLDSSNNLAEQLVNPPCVFTAADNNDLIDALTNGVITLKGKVVDHS